MWHPTPPIWNWFYLILQEDLEVGKNWLGTVLDYYATPGNIYWLESRLRLGYDFIWNIFSIQVYFYPIYARLGGNRSIIQENVYQILVDWHTELLSRKVYIRENQTDFRPGRGYTEHRYTFHRPKILSFLIGNWTQWMVEFCPSLKDVPKKLISLFQSLDSNTRSRIRAYSDCSFKFTKREVPLVRAAPATFSLQLCAWYGYRCSPILVWE